MAINQITVEKVIEALETIGAPASATAISQECGFSKKSAVVTAFLEDLVDEEIVVKSVSSFGFDTYQLVEEEEEDDDDDPCYDDDDDDDDPCCEDGVVNTSDIADKLIENQRTDADGYLPRADVVDFELNEDAKGYKIVVTDYGFKVTFPDNGQDYEIAREERIVVINNEYRAAVTSPEELVGSLQEFTEAKGWKHYVVRDVATGSALAPGRINMKPVLIFLEVERHNKAGF